MKIYVASSWRNAAYPDLIKLLKLNFGRENVYDWRDINDRKGVQFFKWEAIDPNWRTWTGQEYIDALDHPIVEAGYRINIDAMQAADVCVLLLPSGRSSHLEAGWMKGAGKRLIVVTKDGEEPELMTKMADVVVDNIHDLLSILRRSD